MSYYLFSSHRTKGMHRSSVNIFCPLPLANHIKSSQLRFYFYSFIWYHILHPFPHIYVPTTDFSKFLWLHMLSFQSKPPFIHDLAQISPPCKVFIHSELALSTPTKVLSTILTTFLYICHSQWTAVLQGKDHVLFILTFSLPS